jgi:hypothetical protein
VFAVFKRGFIVVAALVVALFPSVVLPQTSAPAIVAPRTFSWTSAANPENVFWPSVSWWWNGPLDSATLQNQLADMKAHEVRNALVFPFYSDFRTGNYHMDPDYLTAGYFDRVQTVVNKAAQLGMNVWLNADGGWPIGFALRHDSQYASQYATDQLVYSNGTWTEQRTTGGYANADLLSAQTTAALLNKTYQPYVGTLGSQLGQTCPFMVTDEAAYQSVSVGERIPWTPGGQTLFQNKFGYDVTANNRLNALAVSPSQLTTAQKQVRVDVIDFVSGQLRDSYFQQSRDWCRAHGMAQIGRLGGEDTTMGAVECGFGSVTRQLRAVDVPGVDAIWRQIFPGQSSNGNFPKFASSVAHQNGTAIVSSLSFPVYGEGLTPAQMKWVLDYQFVRGVTQYATESYPVSTQDDLMTDLRPQWNTSPLWDYMPNVHRYVARLGYVMACGKPKIDVGLYYPVRDLWANASSSDSSVVGFDKLTQSLLERQCDYDVIDDDILNDPATRIENGRLVLGSMSYKTIVVGPTAWMTAVAQQRLNAFQSAGGQVIRITDPGQINSAIAGIAQTVELSVASSGIRAAGRQWDGGGAMYLFNEGQAGYKGVATFAMTGKLYQLDPTTGVTRALNYTTLPNGRVSVSVNLAAGESLLLVAQPPQGLPAAVASAASREIVRSITLVDGWKARVDRQYVVGEHNYEIHETGNTQFTPVALGRWATTLGLTSDFSGHVTYQRTVILPESMRGGRLLLDLGSSLEYAARVKVNGEEVGCVLWAPWTIELPSLGNEFLLEIEMSNTLANELTSQRVRDLWNSLTGPGWPDSYNARQWPFEMESRGGGLLGPVTLSLLAAPEPGSLVLAAVGFGGMLVYASGKRNRTSRGGS